MSQYQKGNRSTTLAPPVLLCAVLALPWALAASPAQAASRQTPEKTARKACLSGDYEKGVAILSDLFVETQDPTWIFNQARCFEQNRRYEDAIARFQEYLRAAPSLSAADKELTEKHIADCREILGCVEDLVFVRQHVGGGWQGVTPGHRAATHEEIQVAVAIQIGERQRAGG